MDSKTKCLRAIPKVDECIAFIHAMDSIVAPDSIIKSAIQDTIATEREKILTSFECEPHSHEEWINLFLSEIKRKMTPHLKRVFNGTGVVIRLLGMLPQ